MKVQYLETGIYLETHFFKAQRLLLNEKRSGIRLSLRDESSQKALSIHLPMRSKVMMINQGDFEARDGGK
jgi:hypothetical protein